MSFERKNTKFTAFGRLALKNGKGKYSLKIIAVIHGKIPKNYNFFFTVYHKF